LKPACDADSCARSILLYRSGDFTLYDHFLDAANVVNAIPERYTKSGLSALDIAFGEFRLTLESLLDCC
jgi:hypothetical protein